MIAAKAVRRGNGKDPGDDCAVAVCRQEFLALRKTGATVPDDLGDFLLRHDRRWLLAVVNGGAAWPQREPAKEPTRPAASASPSRQKAKAGTEAQGAARKLKCKGSGWYQADREWSSRFLYVKAKLTLLDQAVHRELLVHMSTTGKKRRECFPGYQHIADHIGCHRQSVYVAVHRLEDKGFVVITAKAGESHDYYVRTWRDVQQHLAKDQPDRKRQAYG